MATRYVRSTDGVDTDDGTTWALAKATATGVAAIDTAGDTLWFSQNHSEATTGAVTIALAGTNASPTNMLCGNDAAEPPTELATTAIIAATGAITVSGSGYAYGFTLNTSTGGASSTSLTLAGSDTSTQTYDACKLILGATSGASSKIFLGTAGSSAESKLKLINTTMSFGAVGLGLSVINIVDIFGGGLITGTAAITGFIKAPTGCVQVKITGFDFTGTASTLNLIEAPACVGEITFINCKLPASWTGGLVSAAPATHGFRASMYNCDNAATNYNVWIESYEGTIKSEVVKVKTGGATNGTTTSSFKLTTNANAKEIFPLISDDLVIWNDTAGSAKTLTIDILHDSVTALTDAEIWVEVSYLNSASYPTSAIISDHRADIMATAADQTSSSATWTTTGLTNPNTQKLEVTFTPQMKGLIVARVCMAKASYTVYVDATVTVA